MKLRFAKLLSGAPANKPKGPVRAPDRCIFEVKRSILRKLDGRISARGPFEQDAIGISLD
jgi:hypothetical protein